MTTGEKIPANRIVVIMPNWLGDAVMATPFLRALRGIYPEARIAAIGRQIVLPVLTGLPSIDEAIEYKPKEPREILGLLRKERFELAVILPNSFRSAWLAHRARAGRRLGYARDKRSWMLTDRIKPDVRTADERQEFLERATAREAIRLGKTVATAPDENWLGRSLFYNGHRDFRPVPTIDYYLALARYLGAEVRQTPTIDQRRMELGLTAAEEQEAAGVLAAIENQKSKIENLVILVPGANFGSSKCWAPERFAEVAVRLADLKGGFEATVLVASSPAEREIVDAIAGHYGKLNGRAGGLVALTQMNEGRGVSLGALKALVKKSRLMICNDTGPRHFAAALGVPVVTLFGPTDPIWAETFYDKERKVAVAVPCGPCQLKKCPIDHRCMEKITVEMVVGAARELWEVQKFRI